MSTKKRGEIEEVVNTPLTKTVPLTAQQKARNRIVSKRREDYYDAETRDKNADAAQTMSRYRKRVNDAEANGRRQEEVRELEKAMDNQGKWSVRTTDRGNTALVWTGKGHDGRSYSTQYKIARGKGHTVDSFFKDGSLPIVASLSADHHGRAMEFVLGKPSTFKMTSQEAASKKQLDSYKGDLKASKWEPAGGWGKAKLDYQKPGAEEVQAGPLAGITMDEWTKAKAAGKINQLVDSKLEHYAAADRDTYQKLVKDIGGLRLGDAEATYNDAEKSYQKSLQVVRDYIAKNKSSIGGYIGTDSGDRASRQSDMQRLLDTDEDFRTLYQDWKETRTARDAAKKALDETPRYSEDMLSGPMHNVKTGYTGAQRRDGFDLDAAEKRAVDRKKPVFSIID